MKSMHALQKAVDATRHFNRGLLNQVAVGINKVSGGRVTPNSITFLSLIAHFPIALLLASRHYLWGALTLFIFGLLDAVDGPLARLQKSNTNKGMLLDSITDKIKEVLVYIGIVYAFVSGPYAYYAVWATAACGVSLLVSYVNAWGEAMFAKQKASNHAVNQTFRTGLMTYDVRMTVFFVGLLTGKPHYSIVFIAVVSLFTALGRARSIMQSL